MVSTLVQLIFNDQNSLTTTWYCIREHLYMGFFQFGQTLHKFISCFSKPGQTLPGLEMAVSLGLRNSPVRQLSETPPSLPRPSSDLAIRAISALSSSPGSLAAGKFQYRPAGVSVPDLPSTAAHVWNGPALATALIHDYLAQSGGAERVVAVLHDLFPAAPLYTSVYDPKATLACFSKMDVRTSFLQRSFLSSRRFHKFALGLYPLAFEQFDLTDYTLVISSSSSFAKGVITNPETCHICYCHTPARFAWRQHEYLQQSRLTRLLTPWMRGMISNLRQSDFDSAQRVDYFIANSHNVAGRIRKYYRREADAVIYPPVETQRFTPVPAHEIGDHYLVVSRLVGYKRIDLAIEACNRLQVPLRIAGTGPEYRSLRRLAGPTIQFLGRLTDAQVAHEYARCRALIFPGEEDFGLTPVECMASGRPVVAYGRGGALETVTAGKTGVFFEEQTPEAVMKAIQELAEMPVVPEMLQAEAFRFDTSVFAQKMSDFVNRTLDQHRSLYQNHAGRPR